MESGGYVMSGKIFLQKAEMSDCQQMHKMQVESFGELFDKYKDYDTNPAKESVEKIVERMTQRGSDYYFISLDKCNF